MKVKHFVKLQSTNQRSGLTAELFGEDDQLCLSSIVRFEVAVFVEVAVVAVPA